MQSDVPFIDNLETKPMETTIEDSTSTLRSMQSDANADNSGNVSVAAEHDPNATSDVFTSYLRQYNDIERMKRVLEKREAQLKPLKEQVRSMLGDQEAKHNVPKTTCPVSEPGSSTFTSFHFPSGADSGHAFGPYDFDSNATRRSQFGTSGFEPPAAFRPFYSPTFPNSANTFETHGFGMNAARSPFGTESSMFGGGASPLTTVTFPTNFGADYGFLHATPEARAKMNKMFNDVLHLKVDMGPNNSFGHSVNEQAQTHKLNDQTFITFACIDDARIWITLTKLSKEEVKKVDSTSEETVEQLREKLRIALDPKFFCESVALIATNGEAIDLNWGDIPFHILYSKKKNGSFF